MPNSSVIYRSKKYNIESIFSYKFFRLCSDHALADKMKKLLDKLTNRIDKLAIPCCVHVALLGSRILFFHLPTLQKVSEKIYDNIESARLKVIR